MKSELFTGLPFLPSWIPAAAQEERRPSARLEAETVPLSPAFAALVASPEKFATALRAAKEENEAFAASTRMLAFREPALERAALNREEQNAGPGGYPVENEPETTRRELRNTEFSLAAPDAKSVRLAADFTDWDKCALDMIRSRDGTWVTSVPLSRGSYAYRFIVDGHGTSNAIKNVG